MQKRLHQVTACNQETVRVISDSSCDHQQENNKCHICYYIIVCNNEPCDHLWFLAWYIGRVYMKNPVVIKLLTLWSYWQHLCSQSLYLPASIYFFFFFIFFCGVSEQFAAVASWFWSIHPFSSTYPRSGRGGSRISRMFQTSFSPAILSSSSQGTRRCLQSCQDM